MKETNMSRFASLIAALPIAGLVLFGGAGTALAATPTTGPVLACSPAGCPGGDNSNDGNAHPEGRGGSDDGNAPKSKWGH
jgi:hypothetical protein